MCRILRSWKMREITGMEVTATAIPTTSSNAQRWLAAPISDCSGSHAPNASTMLLVSISSNQLLRLVAPCEVA